MSVSSVKNLNGDTFSAVQDLELTNFVQTNSGSWNNVSSKLDTTAFSDVSGTFLTAVDLTPYQTTAGMTAYQESLTFDYNDSDEISAINSSAIAAGGDGDMDSTLLEYNDYNNISGYNGSAFNIGDWNYDEDGGSLYNDVPFAGKVVLNYNGLIIGSGVSTGYSASYNKNLLKLEYTNQSIPGVFTKNKLEVNCGGHSPFYGYREPYIILTNTANNTARIDISSINSWNNISSKQDTLTFGYDGQDKISAINNSAIAGAGSLDIVPISGTGSVNVYEQSNVLWVSGKDFTSDINYISGVVGDVETLLASL